MPDPRLYDQLKNPDAARREAAVKELARSKDPEAIPYLERVVDHDEAPNVREMAEKAILYIKRNSGGNEAPVAPSSPIVPEKPKDIGGAAVVGAAPAANLPPKIVSARDEERSKRMLTDAITYNMKGNDLRAIQMITDAFKINPNLKNDKYAYGVISNVTGMYGEEAIRAITDGSLLAATIAASKSAGKAKRGGESGKAKRDDDSGSTSDSGVPDYKEATFASALADLLIYGLVTAVLVGGTIFFLVYVVLANIPAQFLAEPLNPSLPLTPGIPYSYGDLLSVLTLSGAGIIIIYSLLTGLFQIIGTFVHFGAVHWVAGSLFQGDGTFAALMHRLSVFYTITTPIYAILQLGGIFLPFYLFSTTNDLATAESVSLILGILTLGFSIYILWGTATRIGRTYDFGTGSGCLSLIVSSIVLAILCFGLTFGLAYLLSSSVGSFAATLFALP